jgi:hypothetical protein
MLYLRKIKHAFIFGNTADKNAMFFAHDAEAIRFIVLLIGSTAAEGVITRFMILPADGSISCIALLKPGCG